MLNWQKYPAQQFQPSSLDQSEWWFYALGRFTHFEFVFNFEKRKSSHKIPLPRIIKCAISIGRTYNCSKGLIPAIFQFYSTLIRHLRVVCQREFFKKYFSSKSVPPMYRSSRIHDPKPKRYSKCDLRANEQVSNTSSTARQTRTANRTYVASPNKRKPRSANMQTGVRSKSKKQRSILGKWKGFRLEFW